MKYACLTIEEKRPLSNRKAAGITGVNGGMPFRLLFSRQNGDKYFNEKQASCQNGRTRTGFPKR